MSLSQTCSKCGYISQKCSNCGHNYQTCNNGGKKSIMLFGVRITEGTNNTNTNNLSHHQQLPPQVSTTDVSASSGSHECKRGEANEGNWTEEEHKLFLEGLKHDLKGKWKEISRDYVKTRTSTQVASHAQKYFRLRPNKNHHHKGKPSIFDVTIDTEGESSTIMEDEQIQQQIVVPLPPPTPTAYPSTHNGDNLTGDPLPVGGSVALWVRPLSLYVDLNNNGSSSSIETFPLSLKLQSLPPSDDHSPESSSHSSPSTLSSSF